MFLPSKALWGGIVFTLLTTGISGPYPTPLGAESNPNKEAPADAHPNDVDVKEMQQTLRDKGHYRGNVDGVFGLRSRASIRAYQRAESLPVTGQLDVQTAGKLGVTPESSETVYDTTQAKPSAGIAWSKGSGRKGKTPRK